MDKITTSNFKLKQPNKNNTYKKIEDNLDKILSGTFSSIKCKSFNTGCTANVWLLELDKNTKIVLKQVPYEPSFISGKIFENLLLFSKNSKHIIKPLHQFKKNNKHYVLYEYAEPIRKTNAKDLDKALIPLLKTSELLKSQIKLPERTENEKFFIKARGLKIYDANLLNKEITKIDPKLKINTKPLILVKKLVKYFSSNQSFASMYKKLPKSFIHGDLTSGNIIVTKNGYKIIDWDAAYYENRIKEISVFLVRQIDKPENFRLIEGKIKNLLKVLKKNDIKLNETEIKNMPIFIILSLIESSISWICSSLVSEKLTPPLPTIAEPPLKDKKTKEILACSLITNLKFIEYWQENNSVFKDLVKKIEGNCS
ncbi:phosphotransferase [Candidatus Margulisiibacteriota bacterium]